MPAYDYRCKDCRHTFTRVYASYEAVEQTSPTCPKCGSSNLSRLIRRVGFAMGEEARLERLSDPSRYAGLDEEDPRSMARFMREMATETGEDMGPEFHEMVDRLEAGESPESIDQSMGDLDSDADL